MVESNFQGDGQQEEFQEQYYTDPNGVPMPRRSLTEQQYTDEQLRSMKQKFLLENVINCGYDATEFAQFMEYKMGKLSFPLSHANFLDSSPYIACLMYDLTLLSWVRGRHKCGQLGV